MPEELRLVGEFHATDTILFPVYLHDHFRHRHSEGVHEALRQFPGQRLGAPEPQAVPAVQRRRQFLGAAGNLVVRRAAGEGHQARIPRFRRYAFLRIFEDLE